MSGTTYLRVKKIRKLKTSQLLRRLYDDTAHGVQYRAEIARRIKRGKHKSIYRWVTAELREIATDWREYSEELEEELERKEQKPKSQAPYIRSGDKPSLEESGWLKPSGKLSVHFGDRFLGREAKDWLAELDRVPDLMPTLDGDEIDILHGIIGRDPSWDIAYKREKALLGRLRDHAHALREKGKA